MFGGAPIPRGDSRLGPSSDTHTTMECRAVSQERGRSRCVPQTSIDGRARQRRGSTHSVNKPSFLARPSRRIRLAALHKLRSSAFRDGEAFSVSPPSCWQ